MLLIILIGFVSILFGFSVMFKWIPKDKMILSNTQAHVLDGLVYLLLFLLTFSIFLWVGWNTRVVNFQVFRIVFSIGLIVLLLLYPINRIFANYQNKVNFKTLSSCITYLVMAIGVIPFLNIALFQSINPILGFERKVIFKSSDLVLEKEEDVIKSGGQNTYVIYRKSILGDVLVDDFMGYSQEYENQEYWLRIREELSSKSQSEE
jgi:hypothetical protein